MADFAPVAAQARPPQGMSLGEMVNLANAAQQYQQAQQMNPLQVQRAQAELSRLQALTPLEISRATSEAGRSGIEYNVAGETAEPRISQAKSSAETARIQALKENYGLDSQQHSDFAKILGGFAYDPRLAPENLAKNPNDAVEIMHDIRAEAKARGIPDKKLDVITSPGMTMAMKNPSAFPSYLQNMTTTGMTAAEQRAAGLQKVETTGAGQVVRTTPQVYGQKPTVSYETPGGVTPAQQMVEINGVKYFVGAPKTAGGQPTLTPMPAPTSVPTTAPVTQPSAQAQTLGNAPAAVPSPQPSQSKATQPSGNKLINEDMPVPVGGLRQMNTQQQARYEVGQKMFSEASDINSKAADQKTILDSIKQNLAQAQSSRPGQLLRQGSKFIKGSEQLDTLLKDLAQNQMAQAKVMGGVDSVNAENTLKTATGSADIDPKALAKIIERADATRLAAQLYNQGLSAYKQRDPLNSAIHADRFQQAWKDNYDPRIFMVDNINNSNMSAKEKKDQIKRIIGIAPDKELQQLKQKAINIRRLQTGDF